MRSEVQDSRFDLRWIHLGGGHVGLRIDVQLDAVAHLTLQHGLQTLHQLVQIYQLRLKYDLLGVLLQLPGEHRHALGGLQDLLHVVTQRARRRQGTLQLLAIARNDHQQVVEVVRDLGRQAAQRLYLLRLATLLIGRAASADVEREARELERPPFFVALNAHDLAYPNGSSGGRDGAVFAGMAGAGIHRVPVEIHHAIPVFFVNLLTPEIIVVLPGG